MNWDRGDDKKSSKIYYKIDGVGIDNEDDWQVIAKFHAKWTTKLYAAIVMPLMRRRKPGDGDGNSKG